MSPCPTSRSDRRQWNASEPLVGLSKPLPLWDKIWLLPAMGALIIQAISALLFKYKEEPPKATTA